MEGKGLDLADFKRILKAERRLNCIFWRELSETDYAFYSSYVIQLATEDLRRSDEVEVRQVRALKPYLVI